MAEIDRNPRLIEAVRSNPFLYLSPGKTTHFKDLAIELATDALYLGAADVRIRTHGEWFLVSSSTDWLTKQSKWSAAETFYRVEVIHEYRKNASRAPVLVAAFAKDVVTYLGGCAEVIQGCVEGLSELSALIEQSLEHQRVVAFRGSHESSAA